MLTKKKRDEVRKTIIELLKRVDPAKTSVEHAYDELYPDQVDFGTFVDIWTALRNPRADVSHTDMLSRIVDERRKGEAANG